MRTYDVGSQKAQWVLNGGVLTATFGWLRTPRRRRRRWSRRCRRDGTGRHFPLIADPQPRSGDVSSRESGCNYWLILPGLLLYGGGLAIVLTVNDPVSLSDVPEAARG